MHRVISILERLRSSAFGSIDIASLVFFRIAFGLLMIWEVWRYFSHHRIGHFWLEPSLLFKYYGFSWVHPWPGNGLYIHWAVLGILALLIAVGLFYRVSTALFFLGWTYIFLLDEEQWVNHTYLICLLSFLLIFSPANRAFSIDALRNPTLRSRTAPAWTLWLLRTQMGVVYFFAGIAKISPDWFRTEPMRVWLSQSDQPPIIHRFLCEPWVAYAFSYVALLFDLSIFPLLLWRRTRVAAFCFAVVFHLINARLFSLEVFPWLSIAATTLFLSPSWPRRILSIFRKEDTELPGSDQKVASQRAQSIMLTLVAIYVAIQILVPLRHFLYRGGVEWLYSEHRFSWRMMIQRQAVRAYFYVTDPNSGETVQVNPPDFLDGAHVDGMGWRPDMILQFAHYLAKVMPRSGAKPLRVEARLLVSLNGRKPKLVIDPNVDLAAESRTWGRPRWLLKIHDPLPDRRADPLANPFEPNLLGDAQ
ncbi:MAG: HTTM domain-containing protein [Verrucomicrobiota bacterium]|nr:HTTM domain-containing protein [Verrucomicrobiota bacterium]